MLGLSVSQEIRLKRMLRESRVGFENIGRAVGRLQQDMDALAFSGGAPRDPGSVVLGELDTDAALGQHHPRKDMATKNAIACNRSGRTAVIVTAGQSNAANSGASLYTSKHRVANFDLYSGKCFKASDPLLGTTDLRGNFATRLGDMLIEGDMFDSVVVAPIGMDGTRVEQWAVDGVYNRRIVALLARLAIANLEPDFILWHQGEANQADVDPGGRQYLKNLREVVATFRQYGATAPFFVAQASLCGGRMHANAVNVRAGQGTVVNSDLAIFQGPDTDTLGQEFRYDMCHFNEAGLNRHAAMWAEVIGEYVNGKRNSAISKRAGLPSIQSGTH